MGAVGFAASARRLKARDAWMGWDDAHRRAHLHRVVGLCRLLIRPGVACHNLASHVLGRTARAVGEDFERLYGYRPWLLETFVDEREHTGASLRAANWVRVGESCGRGRQDRTHAGAETRKAVYVSELEPAWRTRLALSAPGLAALAPGEGLDAGSWAANEFGGAPLGDARLSARLVESAHHMAQCPMRAITGATHGARAVVKGHYRLIDQPAEGEVTVEHTVRAYKGLSVVERAFRSLKTVDLKLRPIYHYAGARVRAHVFLCMLAYYVEWHMRQRLKPLLFDDEEHEAAEAARPSIVAPAEVSPSAQDKARRKRTASGESVHSFRTLLDDLAMVGNNRVVAPLADAKPFDLITRPTALQRKAFKLLGVRLERTR